MKSFEELYPNISAWVYNGEIRIGCDECDPAFLRVNDVGGTIWESKKVYASLDEAFAAIEAGIAQWCQENGIKLDTSESE